MKFMCLTCQHRPIVYLLEKIIQRVGIMWQGRLVALGWPSELKQQIAQQLRLELFMAEGSRPQLPPHLPLHELDRGRWLNRGSPETAGAFTPTGQLVALPTVEGDEHAPRA